MKILVDHQTALPGRMTGITSYAFSMVEALARVGRHRYVLATAQEDEDQLDRFAQAGVRILRRPPGPRNEVLRFLRESLSVDRLALAHGCDLIFHPSPPGALRGRTPSVVTLHDLYRLTHPRETSLARRLQWASTVGPALRKADAVIAVSHATAAAAADHYPFLAGRLHVVHEAARAGSAPPQAVKLHGPPYVLTVANVTFNKNLELLMEALERLRREGAPTRLVHVGHDGEGRLAAARARHPQVEVESLPSRTEAQLAALYAGAAAYAATSTTEGFCLPLLEAQAAAAPVVCSDIPVFREVAGEGALYAPLGDPAAFAEALRRVVGDPGQAAALVAAGHANARGFSWEKAAREAETVFDAAAEAPPPRSRGV